MDISVTDIVLCKVVSRWIIAHGDLKVWKQEAHRDRSSEMLFREGTMLGERREGAQGGAGGGKKAWHI